MCFILGKLCNKGVALEEYVIPGFAADNALAKKSAQWRCNCAADKHRLLALPSYDPETEEQTILCQGEPFK